jgi:hypothetical protein
MNNEQLRKAIELSKKTGDRLMVYDLNTTDDAFIVMAIDDYEKMVLNKKKCSNNDLTDDELTDKINRDIASWKEAQGAEREEIVDDEENQSSELIYDYRQDKGKENEKNEHWNIPKTRRGNINI